LHHEKKQRVPRQLRGRNDTWYVHPPYDSHLRACYVRLTGRVRLRHNGV